MLFMLNVINTKEPKMNSDPLKIIQERDLPLYEQINSAREMAFKDGELSKKNKLLIALAIDAAKLAEAGVKSLAIQAMKNGATKNEIMETLRVANYICGVGSMYTAARALQDVL
jgi:alkylhydroperoxidase/carboxymuconolactone decarboxylase family protein YurZ